MKWNDPISWTELNRTESLFHVTRGNDCGVQINWLSTSYWLQSILIIQTIVYLAFLKRLPRVTWINNDGIPWITVIPRQSEHHYSEHFRHWIQSTLGCPNMAIQRTGNMQWVPKLCSMDCSLSSYQSVVYIKIYNLRYHLQQMLASACGLCCQ